MLCLECTGVVSVGWCRLSGVYGSCWCRCRLLLVLIVMESKPVPAKLLHAAPPYGQIISHQKWRGSSLLQSLRGQSFTSLDTCRKKEMGPVA